MTFFSGFPNYEQITQLLRIVLTEFDEIRNTREVQVSEHSSAYTIYIGLL